MGRQGIFGRRPVTGGELAVQPDVPSFGRRRDILEWSAAEEGGEVAAGDRLDELLWRISLLVDGENFDTLNEDRTAVMIGDNLRLRQGDSVGRLVIEAYLPDVGSVTVTGGDLDELMDNALYFGALRPIDGLSVCAATAVRQQVGRRLDDVTQALIQQTVIACHGDTAKAVDLLGLSLFDLAQWLDHFSPPDREQG